MELDLILNVLNIYRNHVMNYFQLERSYDILQYIVQELIQSTSSIFHSRYKQKVKAEDIANKFVVITDGDSKYGRNIAKFMVENGAKVIIGFTQQHTLDWLRELNQKSYGEAYVRPIALHMDYHMSISVFASIVFTSFNRIDILICNACVMSNANTRESLKNSNIELHFGANHLGHLLLIQLLLDLLKESASPRIVIESSASYIFGTINFDDTNMENNYSTPKAYFQSQLANILIARHFARFSNVHTYSVHPGYSKLRNELDWSYNNNAFSYIERLVYRMYAIVCRFTDIAPYTTLYCALNADVANESGYYYSNCRRVRTNDSIVNDITAERLWNLSCDWLGIDRHFLITPSITV